jgi:hypothetical protein
MSSSGGAGIATSGSVKTQAANELLVGAGMTFGSFDQAMGGFTTRMITRPDFDIAADRVVTSSGSFAFIAPASANWVAQTAAFRASR